MTKRSISLKKGTNYGVFQLFGRFCVCVLLFLIKKEGTKVGN